MEDKKKLKRLAVNLPSDIHAKIKLASVKRNITITKWVMRAIFQKLVHDKKFDLD